MIVTTLIFAIANTTLSLTALGFLVAQFLVFPLSFLNINFFNSLLNISYILISLVLVIISYCKHKDTLGKIVMIIDIVLLCLAVVGVILFIWTLSILFHKLLQ